jgi:glycogen debranching enzyme
VDQPLPLTWSALAPLALPDLPQVIARRLIEEYLLDPRRFWLPVAPPSVSADEPSFAVRERFWGLRRYWRGPTWVNSAWLVWLGLVRLGYAEHADTLARGVVGAVRAAGLREFYGPRDGRGMGARDFAFSALAIELEDPDERALTSYL